MKPLLIFATGLMSACIASSAWAAPWLRLGEFGKGQAARTRAAVYYAGPMGAGQALMSDYEVEDWKYVPPGTTLEPQWRYACASKRNVQPR